jgi:predicted transcriptional regulator
VSDVVIYCTKPVGKIVAEFSIAQVLEDRPELIWRKTAAASGISKEYFDSYFQGRDKAFAIEIGNLLVYNYPVAPEDVIQNFTAPQSYRYLPAAGINPQMELAV